MPIQIKLVYQHELSESGSRFLVAAQKRLKERGVDFSYAELPAEHWRVVLAPLPSGRNRTVAAEGIARN
jgi:hypothetical protein